MFWVLLKIVNFFFRKHGCNLWYLRTQKWYYDFSRATVFKLWIKPARKENVLINKSVWPTFEYCFPIPWITYNKVYILISLGVDN